MRTIRVETSSATVLLTEAPAPKVRDRQTGEIAKDAVSGEALMKVGVAYIDEGESSLIHVTVPESGVTEGLALGSGRSSGTPRAAGPASAPRTCPWPTLPRAARSPRTWCPSCPRSSPSGPPFRLTPLTVRLRCSSPGL
ncbi:hypothetical protein [Streptomyces sp. NBC_01186]|uniref:hypothetical protein n=1 Tax=Streptomyces sp. NBC_01186 TaxID=2903765 RepID=UPI003FA6A9A1